MTVSTQIEVVGLKEALREINQIDKAARQKITREFKQIMKPVVDEAKQNVPKTPPISGWGRSWKTSSGFQMLPWDGNPATKLVDVKVSGKRPREYNGQVRDLAVLIVRWRGAVNTLFDMARDSKTVQGANMIRGLNASTRQASRVMWPAYEAKSNEVEDAIRDEIAKVMAMVNRRIDKGSI
jgi:hypothetical protein